MMTEKLSEEIAEFQEDRKQLSEAKAYLLLHSVKMPI